MIHPTAIIHPGAKIATSVEIGPYVIVGEHVEIGEGTSIGPHCVISGHTKIGRDNKIFSSVAVGSDPQDKKYKGEPTLLEIGDRNTIRESCSINTGTVQDIGITRIGNDNWIMAYVHVAHDCVVGNNTIFANCTQLAGHVRIEDWVILGGFSGIHQFCTLGAHSMTAIGSVVVHDVPPYVMAQGDTAKAHGINSEGLKRRGFSPEAINEIKRAYKTLYRNGLTLAEARSALAESAKLWPEIAVMLEFLGRSTRGIVR